MPITIVLTVLKTTSYVGYYSKVEQKYFLIKKWNIINYETFN